MVHHKSSRKDLLPRLLHYLKPHWAAVLGLFALSLLATPLALLTPLPLKIAVDNVVGQHPLPGPITVLLPRSFEESKLAVLIMAAALLLTVTLLTQLLNLMNWLLRTYIGGKMLLRFRAQLFRHVQCLSLAHHDAKGTSDFVYRIQNDAPALQHIAIDALIPFVTAVFTVTSIVWVTVRIDWVLALVALVVSPALFLLSRFSSRRMHRHWREMKERQSSELSVIHEVLGAIRIVKAFGKEDEEEKRFIRHSNESIRTRMRLALFQGGFDVLVGLITAVGTASVLFLGILRVQSGILTLGELLLVMAYLAQLYGPLKTLSNKATDIQSSLVSAERAFEILDEKPDVIERPHAKPIVRAKGALAFDGVSFQYDPARRILNDISFDIKPGTRVGIIGSTGAGKTTLLSLLIRFYDPTSGRILLDGVDMRDYKLVDLRNQFTIVFQEPVLFSTSIAENIAYARPGASEQEIVKAAQAANAHDFISKLPKGYQTRVGERGMRLSGGERQRISLARAFLKDAPILILDEPTSAVDIKTESGIMDAMERLMKDRTTFMVAHRLSTLTNCELFIHIEHGELVSVASSRSPEELQRAVLSQPS